MLMNVELIFLRTIERARMKCGQYWPSDEQADEQFEEFIVYNNGISENQDFTETQLMLHNTNVGILISFGVSSLHVISLLHMACKTHGRFTVAQYRSQYS